MAIKLRSALLCTAALAAAFEGAPPVFAQDGTGVEEIVITARRRAESLQSVPQAVTALDQKALTERAVFSPYDINKVASGIRVVTQASDNNTPSFAIRGRGTIYGASAGSVETYFSEVPLSPPFQQPTLPVQLFDLESAQVLKGPQGTLFGRNTTAGAVLLVPHAPENEFGGYFRAQAGDYSNRQFEGAVNIPIVKDKVLLRVAGFLWQRDGYGKTTGGFANSANPSQILPSQEFNNVNTKQIRATLELRPTERLTNTTLVTYHWDKTRSNTFQGWNILGPGLVPGSVQLPAVPGQIPVYTSPHFGTYITDSSVDLTRPANKVWAVINTTTFELTDNLTIKNIFGDIRAKGPTLGGIDIDTLGQFWGVDVLPAGRANKNHQQTEELQLQGNLFDDRLTFTVGGLLDNTYEPGEPENLNFSSITVAAPPFPFLAPPVTYSSKFTQTSIRSRSLFGAGTFKVTDTLTFEAGYRYAWETVFVKQGSVLSPTVSQVANPATLTPDTTYFQAPTYNAGLSWQVTPNHMIYGGYRHGFKRGGYTSTIPIPSLAGFAPEKVDNYHLGAKNDFTVGGMRGRLNAEIFYDKYKGMQVNYVLFDPLFGLISPTINVPETEFYGLDLDFVLEPTDWLNLSGNYSYLHAKNGPWPDESVPGSTADLSVNPVAFAPKHTVSATARFHKELPNNVGELALAPSVSYSSIIYGVPFSALFPAAQNALLGYTLNQNAFGAASIPPYALVDLRLEWNRIMGSTVSAAAQVTNLTNKYYRTGGVGGTLAFGGGGFGAGAPRMFFVEVSTTF